MKNQENLFLSSDGNCIAVRSKCTGYEEISLRNYFCQGSIPNFCQSGFVELIRHWFFSGHGNGADKRLWKRKSCNQMAKCKKIGNIQRPLERVEKGIEKEKTDHRSAQFWI